jgi:phytoene synthase
MNAGSIAPLIQSCSFGTCTTDALKDDDNAGWLLRLAEPERSEWLTVLEWMRSVDRLVEHETFDGTPLPYAYDDYMRDWRSLRAGALPLQSPFRDLFERLAKRWSRDAASELDVASWDLYLDSLWRYRRPEQVIRTMNDFRVALHDLSAGIFRALPFKPRGLDGPIGMLGAVDQFFNNLRDLLEDTDRGICYLPDEVLARFEINRAEMPRLVRTSDARFVALYEHLLGNLVPELLREAAPVFAVADLHPTWRQMLHHVRMRHARIEYVARRCRFDASAFETEYWPLARRDLLRSRS